MKVRHALWQVGLAVSLSGCATTELATAPQRPDQPWTPNVSVSGEILPGRPSAQKGLAIPAGYSLPSNRKAVEQGRSPELVEERGHAYALAELIDVAQSSNPQTRMAWDTARDAALAVGVVKSTYLPFLSASVVGGWSRSWGRTTNGSLEVGDYGSLNSDGTLRNRNSGSGEIQTLGLKWLLFDFGRREAVMRAAREDQVAANVIFTGAHQKIIYQITIAFYAHAAAARQAQLAHIAVGNAERVQAAAEARLKHGQGTIMDVAEARQATAQVELRAVQSDGAERNTYLALLTAVGVSADTQITLENVSDRHLTMADVQLSRDVVRQAVARRPDVLAAYAATKAAHNRIEAARASFRPSIFVSGNASYVTGGLNLTSIPSATSDLSSTLNVSGNRFSTLVLGGITVPIFDGGLRSAILKRAEDQEDRAQSVLRQTVNDSIQQVVTAEDTLHTSLAAYEASTKLRKASQINFDASLTAYQSGEGSITRTELASNGLLDAEINQSNAYFASLIAAAGLAFGMGSLG